MEIYTALDAGYFEHFVRINHVHATAQIEHIATRPNDHPSDGGFFGWPANSDLQPAGSWLPSKIADLHNVHKYELKFELNRNGCTER